MQIQEGGQETGMTLPPPRIDQRGGEGKPPLREGQ
jgi:hypothetical protein